MLQSLRDYFSKGLIALLLGLLGLLIVGGGFYIPSSRSKADQAVLVKVNKKKIRRFQLEMGYQALKQQQQQMDPDFQITPEMEETLRLEILKQLVMMEVLKQRAYANGYRIHGEDVLSLVKLIPALQVDNQFSPKRFAQILAATGYTRAAFLKELADSRLLSQLSEAIMGSAFVLPKEANQAVRLAQQQRDFSYLELKAKHFAPLETQLSIEEAQAYYDQHLSAFRIPEQVSVDYILLSRTDMLNKLKAAHPNHTADVEAQATKQFSEAIDRLMQLSNTYPRSLSEIAQAFPITIQSTPLFDRTGGSSEIAKHSEVIKAAFSPEVRQGYHSPVIRLDTDRIVMLRLKQHQPLRLPAFDEVQGEVRQQLSLQKGRQAAQRQGEQWIEKIKQDPNVSLNLPAHTQWRKVEKVTRDNDRIPAFILSAAFAIPHRDARSKVQGITLPNGDYVIIRLSKVRYGTLSQLEDKQRDFYRNGLSAELGQLEYMQYIHANERRANITYTF